MLKSEKKSDDGIKIVIPSICVVILLFIQLIPMKVSFLSLPAPYLTFIAVYFWSVYRPDLLPNSLLFIFGALQDLLMGAPLGMSSMLFIITRTLIITIGRSFLEKDLLFNWFIFILYALVYAVMNWLIMTFYVMSSQDFFVVLKQGVSTILLLPIVFWLFNYLNMLLTEDVR